MAACCTVAILSLMLDEVSRRIARSSGTLVAAKNDTSCWTPSSNTEKSCCERPVTNLSRLSVTITFSETRSTPLRKVRIAGSVRICAPAQQASQRRNKHLHGTPPSKVRRAPLRVNDAGCKACSC